MTGLMASATICGALLGAGLWLLLVRLPFMRATSFAERIGPQLKSHNLESKFLRTSPRNVTPFGPLERILRPVIRDGMVSLSQINLGASALNRRLVRSGSTKTAAISVPSSSCGGSEALPWLSGWWSSPERADGSAPSPPWSPSWAVPQADSCCGTTCWARKSGNAKPG
jgi:hypothetical protein